MRGRGLSHHHVDRAGAVPRRTGSGNYARVEWFPLACGNDNLNDGDGCSAICTLE